MEAIQIFLDILHDRPDHFDAWIGLSKAYFRSGEFEKCQQSCEEAIRINPLSSTPYLLLAQAFYRLGMSLEICYHMAQTAYELEPVSWETRGCLGWVNMLQGNYPRAIALLEAALDVSPNNYVVLSDLLQVYIKSGKFKLAYDVAKKMYFLKPSLRSAYILFLSFISLRSVGIVSMIMLLSCLVAAILFHSPVLLLVPALYLFPMFAHSVYLLRVEKKNIWSWLWLVFFSILIAILYLVWRWLVALE